MPAGMMLSAKAREAHEDAKNRNVAEEARRVEAMFRRTRKVQQFQRPPVSTVRLNKEQTKRLRAAKDHGVFNRSAKEKRTTR